ncbi:hypothetical protein Tco_1445545 [Tanacetum coccineum]
MSSSSTVTYTSVYTDSEPGRVFWGADEELSDGGYVADSDLDEDSEEDPEEDHDDYPDEEPFEDEEEEEHLAQADSSAVPVVDPVPSAGDTKAFKTDESAPTPRSPQIRIPFAQTRLRRVWKTVRLEPPMSPSMEARIAENAATPAPPSPPPSPLSPWSPPLPYIPSPPLPPPPSLLHLPPLVPTSLPLPSSPLPPLLVLLFIPLPVDHREDIPEAELRPYKRADYGFIGTTDVEVRCQRAEEVSYSIRDVWVDSTETVEEVAPMTLERVNARVTELAADSYPDAGLPYRLTGVTDVDIDAHVSSPQGQLSATLGQIQALQARDQTHNNMPPKRSSATARAAAAAAAAATPMTANAIE